MIPQPVFDTPKRPDFVPGVLVVKIKPDVVANVPDLQTTSVAAARSFRLPEAIEAPFQSLRLKGLIESVVPVFVATKGIAVGPRTRATGMVAGAATFAVSVGGTGEQKVEGMEVRDVSETGAPAVAFARSVREVEDEDLRGINVVRLSRGADLAEIVKEMEKTRGIEYCHRVPARWPAAGTPVPGSVNPMLNRQWGLRAIHWFDTGRSLDASGVKVGVLDTGVDQGHPDLGSSVIADYKFDGTSDTDIVGHGTHVCGIIAANPGNRVGVTGISNCKLYVWKIFGDTPANDGKFYVDEVLYQRALRAAQTSGMQIINLSIGGTQRSVTEEMLFKKVMTAGVIVIAAMGNEFKRGNPPEYPAAYPGVLAVGATEEADRRAPFSNTGEHIALSAPGSNILSTLPVKPSAYRPTTDETNYAAWSGTSMATPHVTAGASLVLAANPGFSSQRVADRLKDTAAQVPAMGNNKRTPEFGSGLLDLKAAVK